MTGAAARGAAYGPDLAAVHAGAFTALAAGAARALRPMLPASARVLDLGCGDGTLARALEGAGHRVTAVDPSPAMVAIARAAAPASDVRVGTALDDDLPRDLDAVAAVGEVLGYATAPPGPGLPALLVRLAGLLRPGGLLLCDLAGPGRIAGGRDRASTAGPGWRVAMEARLEGPVLVRDIVVERASPEGPGVPARERHVLRLHDPPAVVAAMARAGLAARVLGAGYPGVALPRGLTAYLGVRAS